MKQLDGGISAVRGIKTAVSHAGMKKSNDVAVIYSESVATAAAVYTKNQVKSSSLEINKEKLSSEAQAQAIVVLSGVANTLTGKKGEKDIYELTRITAQELIMNEKYLLTATTGKIGDFLPMDKIASSIKGIRQNLGCNSNSAARAIMTTDTKEKELAFDCGGFRIGAIGKGSGMISPNMATMLCFIATDARIEEKQLQKALVNAVEKSFNMISVDGDTSTNDMVIILANGMAETTPGEEEFQKALDMICIDMAKKIASDGEGATKLIQATVVNARSQNDANKASLAIVKSSLVKTAIYGQDANVGRILCAVGYSTASVSAEKISAYIGNVQVVKDGLLTWKDAKEELVKKEVMLTVDLNQGTATATAYGCDMTENYVKINARYHT